jgi:hypothetical protein
MLWKYINGDFVFIKYVPMQDSYRTYKLLLPEIVEYFVLVSYKKKELKYSILLKSAQFPKNIVNLN